MAASHVILSTHMANIDIAILTVLRPMPVVGKTWALAWVRIVARALPRGREHLCVPKTSSVLIGAPLSHYPMSSGQFT